MNEIERNSIMMLENILKKCPEASIANKEREIGLGCRYEHVFTDGLYIRKMFIPKDLVIVTQIHKTKHPYFIMYGDVLVVCDGNKDRITGPYSGITEPGTKRALYTFEDTLWITCHVTDKTDIEEIGNDILANSFEEIEPILEEKLCLGQQRQ